MPSACRRTGFAFCSSSKNGKQTNWKIFALEKFLFDVGWCFTCPWNFCQLRWEIKRKWTCAPNLVSPAAAPLDVQSVTQTFSGAESAEWRGREGGDRGALLLTRIPGFEDRHEKSGKDSSSPTDFLHFKDSPRPLNQRWGGARCSRGKACTRSSGCVRGLVPFCHFSAEGRGAAGRVARALHPLALNKPCPQERQSGGLLGRAAPHQRSLRAGQRPRTCHDGPPDFARPPQRPGGPPACSPAPKPSARASRGPPSASGRPVGRLEPSPPKFCPGASLHARSRTRGFCPPVADFVAWRAGWLPLFVTRPRLWMRCQAPVPGHQPGRGSSLAVRAARSPRGPPAHGTPGPRAAFGFASQRGRGTGGLTQSPAGRPARSRRPRTPRAGPAVSPGRLRGPGRSRFGAEPLTVFLLRNRGVQGAERMEHPRSPCRGWHSRVGRGLF